MSLLPSECPNCGHLTEGHDFNADPGPVQKDRTELLDALHEARPYVFQRIDHDPERADWRTETARDVLGRVDAALQGSEGQGAREGAPVADEPSHPARSLPAPEWIVVCPAKYEGIYPCQKPAGHERLLPAPEGKHLHTSEADGNSVMW